MAVIGSSDLDVVTAGPVDVTPEESSQHLYEAGLAELNALHDRWRAGLAEIHETQRMSVPTEVAA